MNELATFVCDSLDGAEILSVTGEVDLSNKDHLELALHRGLAQHSKSFIANLAELTYADSTCIYALLHAQWTARSMNKSFAIVIKRRSGFHKILQLTGLLETFEVRYA